LTDPAPSPPLVLNLEPAAPIPDRARSWIAVPLRAHAVVAPRPGQAEEANLLQHAVLGLLRTGMRDPGVIGERLVLRSELVEIVMGHLRGEGWIDDQRALTPAGELAIQEPGSSLDYTQLWVFQEPWSGRLLPRFTERLDPAEVVARKGGTITAITGPVGNPFELVATQLSPRRSEYRPLRLEELAIAYGEAQDHAHRAEVAAGGEILQGAVREPRLAAVHGRVRDVLALTYCFTSDRLPRDRQWDVADPFGTWWLNALTDCLVRDNSPELRGVIAGLLKQRGGWSSTDKARRGRRHHHGERVAERGLDRSQAEGLADAWSDVSETLAVARHVRDKLAGDLEQGHRDPEGRARWLARLLDEATGRVVVLAAEALRQALDAAGNEDPADLRFGVLESDKQAYREAARRSGFSGLHDVFVVRGRRSLGARQSVAISDGGSTRYDVGSRLPELVLSNLAQAATDPTHVLRGLGQHHPELLIELGGLVEEPTRLETLELELDAGPDGAEPREAIMRRLAAEAVDAVARLEELAAILAVGSSTEEEDRHG